MERICRLDTASRGMLVNSVKRAELSMRAVGRVIKVARTIADLEGSPCIRDVHVAEALKFRPRMVED